MAESFLFTTSAKVLRESGMQNNPNISAKDDVHPHIYDAEAEIQGSVGARYSLPLTSNANWIGSQAEQMIQSLATKLASAFLLAQQAEAQGGYGYETAMKKLGHVRGKLKKIEDGNLDLYGADGAEIATRDSALAGLEGFPNNTADLAGSNSSPRKFCMDQTF